MITADKSIWRVEGQANSEDMGPMSHDNPWIPVEECVGKQSANARLNYWQHEFPFKDMFSWKITEQCHPPK